MLDGNLSGISRVKQLEQLDLQLGLQVSLFKLEQLLINMEICQLKRFGQQVSLHLPFGGAIQLKLISKLLQQLAL